MKKSKIMLLIKYVDLLEMSFKINKFQTLL